MDNLIKFIEERIKEAEENYKRMESIVMLGRTLGIDVSKEERELAEIKAKIERYKRGLEEYKKSKK